MPLLTRIEFLLLKDNMHSSCQWSVPPIDIQLSENEVHIWKASLEVPNLVAVFRQVLSLEERARADRFRAEKDRNSWIVARGLLRVILSYYLDMDPRLFRFRYNAWGKPSLEYPFQAMRLQFNLSHSSNLALYAFTLSRHIGVDIEHMSSMFDYEALAQVSFSPYERAMLHTLPEEAKRKAFFHCWTRKEAYIKAEGKGFSMRPDSFDVSLMPGEAAQLLQSRENPEGVTHWSLQDLVPATDYAGTVAVEGQGWHLRCWQWREQGITRFL